MPPETVHHRNQTRIAVSLELSAAWATAAAEAAHWPLEKACLQGDPGIIEVMKRLLFSEMLNGGLASWAPGGPLGGQACRPNEQPPRTSALSSEGSGQATNASDEHK